ncbi:MAG: rRNA biogenesis protein rrp5 [Lachnospiraceae bacterium]|nr:rRNA biogenesis protein rrp5 [Lachnospiraceae bacterium]
MVVVNDMIEASEKVRGALEKALKIISETEDSPGQPEPEPPKKEAKKKAEEPKAYTKEEVRKTLAALAAENRAQVKALLNLYRADNLSSLDPEHYAAVVADAEAMLNA